MEATLVRGRARRIRRSGPVGAVGYAAPSRAGAGRRRFDRLVEEHLPVLLRKHRQLIRIDDYGLVDRSRWEKEVGYFFQKIVFESLRGTDGRRIEERLDEFKARLEAIVEAGRQDVSAEARFERVRNGVEFELFCAEQLQQAGWRVALTGASRDQGADIVAERGQRAADRSSASSWAGRSATTRCRRWWPPALAPSGQPGAGGVESAFHVELRRACRHQRRRALPLERARTALAGAGPGAARQAGRTRRYPAPPRAASPRCRRPPAGGVGRRRASAGSGAASCGAGRRRPASPAPSAARSAGEG